MPHPEHACEWLVGGGDGRKIFLSIIASASGAVETPSAFRSARRRYCPGRKMTITVETALQHGLTAEEYQRIETTSAERRPSRSSGYSR